MKNEWKHLYGVIKSPEKLDSGSLNMGNLNIDVYPISYQGLAAVVSRVDSMSYKTMPKELILRHLLDHQKVIERVMESNPIIPFKFGSVAKNEKEVEHILMKGYTLFNSLLPWVQDRIEVELVAKWDRAKVFKTLYEEESEIRSLQKMIEGKSGSDTFLEKVKLGKMVEQCLSKRKVLLKGKILSQLRGYAESLSDHEVMDDLMILNTAFLLRRELEKEFEKSVQYLDKTFSGVVSFKLIGPLPLYSFKCIEIEWTDVNEIKNAFSILGVKEGASLTDIKSAYHRKVQSVHPDKTGDILNPSMEFEKAVKAYRLLSRCYSTYQSLSAEGRILMMEIKTSGSNDQFERKTRKVGIENEDAQIIGRET